MVVTILRAAAACLLAVSVLNSAVRAADAEALAAEAAPLLEQLDRGTPSERSAAERKLVDLGLVPGNAEALLKLLPAPSDDMSQEAITRLARIRGQVQTRQAEQAVAVTRVTLDVTDAPLADVLAAIEKQTGNRVVDYREESGDEAPEKKVTLKVDDEPFWSVLDTLLDATLLAPYPYAEGDAMGLVARQEGAGNRVGRAAYAGPFRFEATRVSSFRNLRAEDQQGFEVDMEISWEPRLRPVALSQAADGLSATSDAGEDVPPTARNAAFNIEAPADSHAAEVSVPMQLPSRGAKQLASLKGQMSALIPGRVAELKFENLAAAKDEVQEVGGIRVTLGRAAQNQALWEVYMSIHVGSIDASANSSLGWVFQNVTFLEGPGGERIDHAGFETTMQSNEEAGFVYFFELPEGAQIGDYKWAYRTPVALVSLPVEYELKEIPLP
jgi:hypothetical protein